METNHLLLLIRAYTLSVKLMLCPVTFILYVRWKLLFFQNEILKLELYIPLTSHLHLIPSEIAKSFAQAVHFNTFGGNPIASAVGKAVLEV